MVQPNPRIFLSSTDEPAWRGTEMTITSFVKIKSALITSALAISGFAAPAQAGGFISFNVQPRNADEERVLRTGLGIYALVNGIKDGSIKQKGLANVAGLVQNGRGNLGVVSQKGDGHTGTLIQNGNGNSHGLFQFGRNTNAEIVQNGGGTGATFQWGW